MGRANGFCILFFGLKIIEKDKVDQGSERVHNGKRTRHATEREHQYKENKKEQRDRCSLLSNVRLKESKRNKILNLKEVKMGKTNQAE